MTLETKWGNKEVKEHLRGGCLPETVIVVYLDISEFPSYLQRLTAGDKPTNQHGSQLITGRQRFQSYQKMENVNQNNCK